MKGLYIDNLYIEYELTNTKNNPPKALVFLMGLPNTPKRYEIFNEFKSAGFDIFLPRYEGTWESKGEFLKTSPAIVINDLLEKLNLGIELEQYKYKTNNIYIIGTSFGGGIALSLKDSSSIKSVCAISPVINFKDVPNIDNLESFLNNKHKDNYRFLSAQWNKLINDQIYNPYKDFNISPQKIIIYSGLNDDQIPKEILERFSKSKGVDYTFIPDAGHITISKITKDLAKSIINFFNRNN